ncbi:MAG: translation elongation factor EF-1 subunit alpha [Candidatus Lokiarchaeota archaeon]|nr:translation elongation factor EF-1 subunit alpha [Candidatus Lokiarchaeota archaeon]MBD3339248.1 translation elongation factor EF-1 subunit alpha [Candidatus Lokiarchaeota archaeon]
MADKQHLNLVIIGHIDHGKSTMMGALLIKTGAITDREARELEKIAKEYDRESWSYAYVFDRLKEERQRGITIDLAFRKFETKSKYFTIIDAPGHADFVKNMITGASQADAAILVVSGKKGEMEVGIAANGQTREHAYLAQTLGVKQLVVAINKADVWDYDEDRYKECKEAVSGLLRNIGFPVKKIPFVPVSGLKGENLTEPIDKLSWYDGPTLVEAIDKFEVPEKPLDKPLRLPIQDAYKIKGTGVVPVGRVETGVLKKGDKIVIMPTEFQGEIRSIEMHHEEIPRAEPGDNVGFSIRGITLKDVSRGDCLGHPDNPPTIITPKGKWTGQIIVIWHPTAIAQGYTPVVHAHTAQVAARFTSLMKKLDQKTGAVIEDNPKFLKRNEAAIVELAPIKKLCLEKYTEIPEMGRFAVRDMGRTVAVGIVKEIETGA